MFRLFKRKQQPSAASGAWMKFFAHIDKRQRKVADGLSQRSAYWPRRYIKAGLIIFCLCYGALSTYFIVRGVVGHTKSFEVDAIKVPVHVVPAESMHSRPTISRAEYEQMLAIQLYMDSLRLDPQGSAFYDAFVQAQPGLLDSLNHIISIYEENVKK